MNIPFVVNDFGTINASIVALSRKSCLLLKGTTFGNWHWTPSDALGWVVWTFL
jgi:hypothetical protein